MGAGGPRQLGITQHGDRGILTRVVRQLVQGGGEGGVRPAQLILNSREGVQDKLPAGAGAPEPGQPFDVGPQQNLDVRQRAGQHGRDLARERLSDPDRVAVSDEDDVAERPQLARGRQRIAAAARVDRRVRPRRRRGRLPGRWQIQDRDVERLVRQTAQRV